MLSNVLLSAMLYIQAPKQEAFVYVINVYALIENEMKALPLVLRNITTCWIFPPNVLFIFKMLQARSRIKIDRFLPCASILNST